MSVWENPTSALESSRKAELLVLDEIGIQRATAWELDLMAQLVDSRYREDRLLVLSTNVEPAELSTFIGRRAADRLAEFGVVVRLTGSSYRETASTDLGLRNAPCIFPKQPAHIEFFRTCGGNAKRKCYGFEEGFGFREWNWSEEDAAA
jgi:hypothetical protein